MTEMQSGLWAIALGGLILGLILGMLIAYWFLPSRRKEREIEELRRQSEDYQRQVYEHFSRTSALFQDLNTNYRALYDHLAKGAHTLVSAEIGAPDMEIHQLNLPSVPALDEREAGETAESPPGGAAEENAENGEETVYAKQQTTGSRREGPGVPPEENGPGHGRTTEEEDPPKN